MRKLFIGETETPWRLNWSVQDWRFSQERRNGQGQVLHACLEWSRTTWPHLEVVQAEMVHKKKVILLQQSNQRLEQSAATCCMLRQLTCSRIDLTRPGRIWPGMPVNRRTPQDTAGRPCNDRRTPKWPIWTYRKTFIAVFDVYFSLFRHI